MAVELLFEKAAINEKIAQKSSFFSEISTNPAKKFSDFSMEDLNEKISPVSSLLKYFLKGFPIFKKLLKNHFRE